MTFLPKIGKSSTVGNQWTSSFQQHGWHGNRPVSNQLFTCPPRGRRDFESNCPLTLNQSTYFRKRIFKLSHALWMGSLQTWQSQGPQDRRWLFVYQRGKWSPPVATPNTFAAPAPSVQVQASSRRISTTPSRSSGNTTTIRGSTASKPRHWRLYYERRPPRKSLHAQVSVWCRHTPVFGATT